MRCTTLGANFFFATGILSAGEADAVALSALDSGAGVEAALAAPPLPRNEPRPRTNPRVGAAPAAPPLPLVLKLANLCTVGLPLPAGGGTGVSAAAEAPPMLATGAAFSCGCDSLEPAGSALTCGSISIGSAAAGSTLTSASATSAPDAALGAPRVAATPRVGARRGGIVGVPESV